MEGLKNVLVSNILNFYVKTKKIPYDYFSKIVLSIFYNASKEKSLVKL